MLNVARIPPTAEVMQRRPPFAISPLLRRSLLASTPRRPWRDFRDVAPIGEGYWAEHARRRLENEERVARGKSCKILDRDLAGK